MFEQHPLKPIISDEMLWWAYGGVIFVLELVIAYGTESQGLMYGALILASTLPAASFHWRLTDAMRQLARLIATIAIFGIAGYLLFLSLEAAGYALYDLFGTLKKVYGVNALIGKSGPHLSGPHSFPVAAPGEHLRKVRCFSAHRYQRVMTFDLTRSGCMLHT